MTWTNAFTICILECVLWIIYTYPNWQFPGFFTGQAPWLLLKPNQTPFGNSALMGFIAHQPCLQRTPSSLSSTLRDKVLSVIVS